MATRFAAKIGLRNDLDPDYRHSKYHGTLVDKAELRFNESQSLLSNGFLNTKRRNQVVMLHLFSAVIQILLGIMALPLAFRNENCSRVLPGLLKSIGSYTIIIGVCQAFVALLVYRKLSDRSWFPLLLKSAMMLAGTMFFEGLFYEYLITDSSRKDGCNTQHLDRATSYVIVWAVVEFVLVVYWLVVCKFFRIPSLYSNKLALPTEYYATTNTNAGYASI